LALIEKTKITSPFAGIVDDIQSDIGDFMAVGGICATVIDQDPIIVVSEVPEKHIEKIKQDITAKMKSRNPTAFVLAKFNHNISRIKVSSTITPTPISSLQLVLTIF
jgi:multidrug resistance efflux pump